MQDNSLPQDKIKVDVDEEIEFTFASSAGSCNVDKHLIGSAFLANQKGSGTFTTKCQHRQSTRGVQKKHKQFFPVGAEVWERNQLICCFEPELP